MIDRPFSLIVAVARNGVIGRDGDLPWRISADLQRFKRLTLEHHIVMGRKTLESIGRLLPGRTTVVLTRQADYEWPGARVVMSAAAALRAVANDSEPFVVGGREVYTALLPMVRRIYLTRVLADVDGDTYFDDLDPTVWRLRDAEDFAADTKNEYPHRFERWVRREQGQ